MNKQYGVIHEVGDMGLGFETVSDKDQKTITEHQDKKETGNEKPTSK